MSENIYQAPASDLHLNEARDEFKIASQGQRFVTMIIDMCGYFVFALCIGVVMGLTGTHQILDSMNEHLFGVLILSSYYIPQELFFGRTLGKFVMGTKVLKEDGREANFKDILIRTLCRFIPFEAFSFFGDNGKPRGWHDRISKTSVISLR